MNSRVQSGHSLTAVVVVFDASNDLARFWLDLDPTALLARRSLLRLRRCLRYAVLPTFQSLYLATAEHSRGACRLYGPSIDGLEQDSNGISNFYGPIANIGGGQCPLADRRGSDVVAGGSSSPPPGALKFI